MRVVCIYAIPPVNDSGGCAEQARTAVNVDDGRTLSTGRSGRKLTAGVGVGVGVDVRLIILLGGVVIEGASAVPCASLHAVLLGNAVARKTPSSWQRVRSVLDGGLYRNRHGLCDGLHVTIRTCFQSVV